MAFLQEPRGGREPVMRAPASVIGLIGVIVAAHVVRVIGPDWFSAAVLGRLALIPALYSTAWLAAHPGIDASLFDPAVPFGGYIFLHANAPHLILNCLWLLACWAPAARRLGSWRFSRS